MAKQVSPTRMELLKINQKIKLAKKGHELLKKKRDALTMNLFEESKKFSDRREQIYKDMNEGYKTLIKAEALEGPLSINSIAYATPPMPDINFKWKNVAGVKIPSDVRINEENKENKSEINYGVILTSSTPDNSVEKFSKVKTGIIELITTEEAIIRLSREIIKTKRRVNSLEHILIPNLSRIAKNIRAGLEEIAREEFFRLKAIKRKKERELKKNNNV